MEQPAEHFKIMFYKIVDRPVLGSRLFTDQRKGIFIGDQKESQVVLPQVFIKGKIRRNRQKIFYLTEYPAP